MTAPRMDKTLGLATGGFSISPDNDNDLTTPASAIYVGGAGDIKVDTIDGDTLTFVSHPVGYLPVQVKKVYATGTGATNLIGLV